MHLSPCMCPEYVRTSKPWPFFDLVLPTSYRWPKDPANICMFTNAFLIWTKISWKNPRYLVKTLYYYTYFIYIVLDLLFYIGLYCFIVLMFFCFLIFSFLVVYGGVPVRAPTGLLRFNQPRFLFRWSAREFEHHLGRLWHWKTRTMV